VQEFGNPTPTAFANKLRFDGFTAIHSGSSMALAYDETVIGCESGVGDTADPTHPCAVLNLGSQAAVLYDTDPDGTGNSFCIGIAHYTAVGFVSPNSGTGSHIFTVSAAATKSNDFVVTDTSCIGAGGVYATATGSTSPFFAVEGENWPPALPPAPSSPPSPPSPPSTPGA
jgi:hypothetical protein